MFGFLEVRRLKEVDGVQEVIESDGGRCALLRSGKVYCDVGYRLGQSGIGDVGDLAAAPAGGTFVKNLDDAVSLSISRDTLCAAKKDGHVVCWGFNDSDEIGGDAPFTVEPQEVAFPAE